MAYFFISVLLLCLVPFLVLFLLSFILHITFCTFCKFLTHSTHDYLEYLRIWRQSRWNYTVPCFSFLPSFLVFVIFFSSATGFLLLKAASRSPPTSLSLPHIPHVVFSHGWAGTDSPIILQLSWLLMILFFVSGELAGWLLWLSLDVFLLQRFAAVVVWLLLNLVVVWLTLLFYCFLFWDNYWHCMGLVWHLFI